MRKITFLLLLFAGMANAQNITVSDAAFKAKLLESSTSNEIAQDNMGNNIKIDADSDGEISITEALAVYGLNVSNPYNWSGPFITDLGAIENFPNLRKLNCSVNLIPAIDFTFLGALQRLECYNNLLTALDIPFAPQLNYLDCSDNQITALDVTDFTMLNYLNFSENEISAIDLSPLLGLQTLNFGGNNLTNLDVSANTNLITLDCAVNQLSSLNLAGLTQLKYLNCGGNLLTAIDLTPVPDLLQLDISSNQFSTIDLSPVPNLTAFGCIGNQFASLDLSGLSGLTLLTCGFNNLTSLDLSHTPELYALVCENNQLTSLDLSVTPKLSALICENNLLTTIDGSGCRLINLDCSNNPLETILLKNGHMTTPVQTIDISGIPSLQYICTDNGEESVFQSELVENGYTDCVVGTYCSFTPGGDYNTMDGLVTFDANANGCDASDPKQPNIKLAISDGASVTGASFTDIDGNYNFYTLAGSFTVTPQVENPSFFAFTPADASALFADTNNNVSSNNFCVTANGIHPDVEVVIAPLTRARPGFDATYLIVYKNKGNQTLSGNVTFNYNDAVADLISVTTAPNVQNPGMLQWNYTGLLPFEARGITVTLNINTPGETPPVNLGDILTYTASVDPVAGDELPADNQFTFNHTVVNAFDPNEIICLEGDIVPTDSAGEYLHYIANFENLGTAEAENVVVSIDIDTAKYDINSLQVLNTSHNSYTRVTGNTVEFIFEHIELDAAQGNPPVGGHGNVLFKIKSNESLVQGDFVDKHANIFFDYNFPIETNIAHTVFQTLSTPGYEDQSIRIFPNPAAHTVNILSDFNIQSVSLFDVQGRILETSVKNTNATTVDVSERQTGIYFLKVTTDAGIKVMKLIRE